MTTQFEPRRGIDRELIPPLLIATLGAVGVLALYLLVPRLQFIELVLLLVAVICGAAGYRQGIVRGITTAVFIYIATGIAATFYRVPAPYVAGIRRFFALVLSGNAAGGEVHVSGQSVDGDSLALSFILLTAVIWAGLEALGRTAFRDTSLPKLGILDRLGGVAVHLIVGALVASLLFNASGYGQLQRAHNKALLRPKFNQVLAMHYTAQSFWFPRTPPPIYVYDLDLPRER